MQFGLSLNSLKESPVKFAVLVNTKNSISYQVGMKTMGPADNAKVL